MYNTLKTEQVQTDSYDPFSENCPHLGNILWITPSGKKIIIRLAATKDIKIFQEPWINIIMDANYRFSKDAIMWVTDQEAWFYYDNKDAHINSDTREVIWHIWHIVWQLENENERWFMIIDDLKIEVSPYSECWEEFLKIAKSGINFAFKYYFWGRIFSQTTYCKEAFKMDLISVLEVNSEVWIWAIGNGD
jgi:hypothetical protein